MKKIITIFFILFSNTLFSQGELIDFGESGVAISYLAYKAPNRHRFNSDIRLSLIHLSVNRNRVYEGGFKISKYRNNFTLSPYLAGYIDTPSSLHLKLFAGYNFEQYGPNYISLGGTLFINPLGIRWLVPSLNVSLVENLTVLNAGLNFKFGNAANIIGGIFVSKPENVDLTYSFNMGFLFSTQRNDLPKDF